MTSTYKSINNRSKFKLSKNRKLVWLISSGLCLISAIGMFICFINPKINSPLKLGLDYTGGTQITLERECEQKCSLINTDDIMKHLNLLNIASNKNQSIKAPNLNRSKIRLLDNSAIISIRLPFLSASQSDFVTEDIYSNFGPFLKANTSVEIIGPSLGKQLLQSSFISLLIAFIGIALYINFRYDKIYSFLALLALLHDVLIVCGVFAWLGYFKGIEVDSLFAVSLLTIAGYSVNNTVVVFDRIRERRQVDTQLLLKLQIDNAVTATLTRTIYTSCTTLLPLLCILIWGGSSLYWFSLALIVGVIAGSWSSIALAPSLLSMSLKKDTE